MTKLVFADQSTEWAQAPFAGLVRSCGGSRGEQGHPISYPESIPISYPGSCSWLSWVAHTWAISPSLPDSEMPPETTQHSGTFMYQLTCYTTRLLVRFEQCGNDFCSPSRQRDNEVISTHVCASKHALELLRNFSVFQHQLWRRHTQKNPISAKSKLLAGAKVQNAQIVWKLNTAHLYYKELDRFLVLF